MRVVLFDLGNTLEHRGALLPGALETLGGIRDTLDPEGRPAVLALASDFDMPASPDCVPEIRRQYFGIIERLGIRTFFEPVERRVTLSTEVGVFKPDRRVFQAVTAKLGGGVTFGDIIFITENGAHVAAARQLGLRAVHFKGPGETDGEAERLPDLLPIVRGFVASPAPAPGVSSAQNVRSVRTMSQEYTQTNSADNGGHLSSAAQVLAQAAQSLTDAAGRLTQLSLGVTSDSPGGQTLTSAVSAAATLINIFEDDSFSERDATTNPATVAPVAVGVPVNNNPALQTRFVEAQPAPGRYAPGTADFRFWVAQEALARAINFWAALLPAGTRWSTTNPMRVTLAAGQSLNASYSRGLGLRFFQQTVRGVNISAAESPDVVCHELGHAVLDAIRPELFSSASIEGAAFHESFGDMSSILSALQLPSLRAKVLNETQGRLNVNSRLSRLAEQLGWGIRQLAPTAVDADSLRNAANRFFYQPPTQLPPSAPATQLSTEEHSYSRVFTGAFLDALAGMVDAIGGASDTNLLVVSRDLGQLLVDAVRLAPVTPRYFSQIAANMIQADQTRNGGRYRNALRAAFVQHGILSPGAAAALNDAPVPEAVEVLPSSDEVGRANGGREFGMAGAQAESGHTVLAYDGNIDEAHLAGPDDAPELPVRRVSIGGGMTILAHVAAGREMFGAAPAAVEGGEAVETSAEDDARSFIEDLIQLGRIEFDFAQGASAELGVARGEARRNVRGVSRPAEEEVHGKTHVVVETADGSELKRLRFNCGHARCGRAV